jgi:hypothetical protein
MPLNPPQVGPLSVCSTSVVMQYQLAGAQIRLFVDETAHSLGTASSAEQVMDLPGGLMLQQGARVTATQSLNGEVSQPGIAVVVQGTGGQPSSPQPHPDSHIYSCAGNVFLAGVTPGSTVDVLSGGTVLGSADSPDGNCLVVLSSAVPTLTALAARAATCGHAPVTATLPAGDPPPVTTSERLPAPVVGSPVMRCVQSLRLDAIVPGARVTLRRGDGTTQAWQIGVRSWTITLAKPLQEGENLTLVQEFPLCGVTGDVLRVRVAPLSVPVPRIVSPAWCSGRVLVANLVPGATVVFLDPAGTELGRSGAPGTSAQFTLIQPHTRFQVQQEVCGVRSASSNFADSGSDNLARPSPVMVTPLLACQTEVKVTGQVEGGITEIWSQSRAMIGWRQAEGPDTVVRVSALQPGEFIQANMVTCAGQPAESAQVRVRGVAEIGAPAIRPAAAGDTSVTVTNLDVGARLELFVDGAFVTAVTVTADPLAVPTTMALQPGQRVHARQGLCSQWQKGADIGVTAPPASPAMPTQQLKASKMIIHNCSTNHRPVHIWRLQSNGPHDDIGSLDPDYDDSGTCPAGVETLTVPFPDGHQYMVVAVDPDNTGCEGQNDPLMIACQRSVYPFLITGSGTGQVISWQVDSDGIPQ